MAEIAFLSTYIPKKCGLATYTYHLRHGMLVTTDDNAVRDRVIAVLGPGDDVQAYHSSLWFLKRDVRADYKKLADRVNDSPVSLVSLQHEFGIFGGTAGEYIVDFARELRKPLITTFHTVFEHPKNPYRDIQAELVRCSDRMVVMNRRAVEYLSNTFKVPREKIVYIPHGTPAPRPHQRLLVRRRLGWSGRSVILTFGLLGPGKGIELIVRSLPQVVRKVPDVMYVIAGQTHPEIFRRDGEAYRQGLKQLIQELGLEQNVTMVNRYLSEDELVDLITACDLYVTPYPGMEQITSGTLAYAVGLGKAVLSTPYVYARDLLADCEELLLPFGDEDAWANAMTRLLVDSGFRRFTEERIQRIGENMTWPRVGKAYWNLFKSIVTDERSAPAGGSALASASR